MTENVTFSYFVLSIYVHVGALKYLYFALLLCLYVVTVGANVLLLLVICTNRSLHEPMYLFLCSLCVNEVYGSTGLLPFLLLHTLSDTHTVPAALCFLQIFCIYSYGGVEFTNLAIMAYDRYVAICCPLQYHAFMTPSRVTILIIMIWFYSFVKFLINLSLNIRLRFCGNTINSLYCHNYLIAKLACSQSGVNNIYRLFGLVLSILVPLLPIVFSYIRILKVCFSGSRQMCRKALSTCAPHLVSLLSFSFGCLFEVLQSRFDTSSIPVVLKILLSLYFIIIQPLLTPIIYGIQMSKIQNSLKLLLRCRD